MADAPAIFDFRRRQEVADWLRQKTPHQYISESETLIAKKTFTTPDASGTIGRQFFFAIICLNDPSGRVIGAAGVNSLVPAPSIGYTLHPDFWGKGYATEAVTAIVDQWCRTVLLGKTTKLNDKSHKLNNKTRAVEDSLLDSLGGKATEDPQARIDTDLMDSEADVREVIKAMKGVSVTPIKENVPVKVIEREGEQLGGRFAEGHWR
ncbi:hypothetical protein N7508_007852 [Penicillium antarcticum]|uniref:uncharacterized protein n=1 Tax=Penicillium antarcticum TaxID=416450 RepID=UPI00239DF910|nr:uncharacterized protein N7508_007852 [Penicillium antarcticum]KAJ5297603.1 hypothetical protein N7508_007852 [Penicillium antarcticum]